jgi:alpha/beta superfamily hydrolase
VSPMVEVTPAMKRMAKEQAEHMKAEKKDLKARYELERDEKLKTLGLENCDKYFKEKIAEVKKIAGEAAGDDSEEEMMIIVEDAPEAEVSEAV